MDRHIRKTKEILSEIYKHRKNFYYLKYSKEGINKKDILSLDKESFTNLPLTSLKELAEYPYKNRILNEDVGFNKLIFSEMANRYFLLHRNLNEIKNSALPKEGVRPMVIMQDVYEAIEVCLFLYEQKILPLIGEVLNPAVIFATASQYDVDSLYADHQSIMQFREGLLKQKLKIKYVTVIDSSFNTEDFNWPKYTKVSAVLSLPEFGRIAYSCPEAKVRKEIHFHAYDDTFIEPGKSAVLTSTRLESCPMIRYRSSLSVKSVESRCNCKKPTFFLE